MTIQTPQPSLTNYYYLSNENSVQRIVEKATPLRSSAVLVTTDYASVLSPNLSTLTCNYYVYCLSLFPNIVPDAVNNCLQYGVQGGHTIH